MELQVMILDDEYIILDGLCSFPWSDYGYRISATARNGLEGLEKLEQAKPDLILTDVKMPGMDGLDFAERAHEIYPNAVIVILTGYDSFAYAQKAISIGVEEYLLKPVDYDDLKAMAAYSGFAEEDYDTVFIILDKMDKIGLDGVAEELEKEGYAKESIEKYLDLFKGIESAENGIAYLADTLKDVLDEEVSKSLNEIITSVEATKEADFEMVFDPTLVRGMSYYTGTIFEIAIPEFGGSCGGGGRYDKMVGRFTGKDVPACGFSIGFERIVLLLLENGFEIPTQPKKKAYLIEKGYTAEKLCEVMKQAQEERKAGQQVLVSRMNKNKKFQKEQLAKEGYEEIVEFFNR